MTGTRRDWATNDKERDPPPSWDGSDPARNLKKYLKALRFWKHDTVVPHERCGSKLYKSLPLGAAHR